MYLDLHSHHVSRRVCKVDAVVDLHIIEELIALLGGGLRSPSALLVW